MSYSVELKKELLESIPDSQDIINVELAGIIISGAQFVFDHNNVSFTIKTENASLARYIFKLIEHQFQLKANIDFTKSTRFHKHRTYILSYENAQDLLEKIGVVTKGKYSYYSPILATIVHKSRKEQIGFIKGIFLCSGSISNPEKRYHLEIDAPNEAVTQCCSELLKNFGISGRLIEVKKHSVLYLKDSQAISDFLGLIGASKAMLEYEDKKIVKQMRGDINRKVNCETANINKTAKAASIQIEAIDQLKSSGRLKILPDDLKQAAELRKRYPNDSITELGKRVVPNISRTTLHRRLKRIVEFSENSNESETEN